MNWNVMMDVVMSMVFFAPLVIVLVAVLFVGVLVALEGAASLVGKKVAGEEVTEAVPTPEAGEIVAGLDEAIEAEGRAAKATPEEPRAAKR